MRLLCSVVGRGGGRFVDSIFLRLLGSLKISDRCVELEEIARRNNTVVVALQVLGLMMGDP